jgi:hypothetical protein
MLRRKLIAGRGVAPGTWLIAGIRLAGPFDLLDARARLASLARGRLGFALAAGGVGWVAIQLAVGYRIGIFNVPAGDVLVWHRAGADILRGQSPYLLRPFSTNSFWYAPPWALFFALFAWLPPAITQGVMWILDVLALRYVAGSWRGAALACWFPVMAFEFAAGTTNLIMAAAIVAAVRDDTWIAAVGALAKFAPVIAIRDWRRLVIVLAVLGLPVLMWPSLWVDWLQQLVGAVGFPLGPQIPVPLWARLVLAGGLLVLVRRPWGRALAAVVAIPAFYWVCVVELIAPLAIWLRQLPAPALPLAPAAVRTGPGGPRGASSRRSIEGLLRP